MSQDLLIWNITECRKIGLLHLSFPISLLMTLLGLPTPLYSSPFPALSIAAIKFVLPLKRSRNPETAPRLLPSAPWTARAASWATATGTSSHRTNRRDGGPSAWSTASTSTWPRRPLGSSSTPMAPVWRRSSCGRWNPRTPVKVSTLFFNKFFHFL